MAMTEQQIQHVIAAKNGDKKSFEQLYTTYYSKVYGFARMILKNEHDAEDVLQETFITAWRKLDTLETPATFFVWIQIIAKNLCNMQLRRKNLAILLDADQDIENFELEEAEEMLPAVYAERADLKERLGRIIDSLSDVQRQTVTLYYFNELSVDEISQIMECSPGTVKSRLFLARKAIKTEVEEQERKSGERFYGVAGIAMLPFGKLIFAHMESWSIGQGAANASLSVIASAISDPEVAGAAAATGTQQAKALGAKIPGTMPLKVKVIAGVSAVAAVGAATALTVILATGGVNKNDQPNGGEPTPSVSVSTPGVSDPTPSESEATPGASDPTPSVSATTPSESDPTPDVGATAPVETSDPDSTPGPNAFDTLWERLNGYWTSGEMFIGIFKDSSAFNFEYGLRQSSYWIGGDIIDVAATGWHTATLAMHIPASPAAEPDGARPERTEMVYIDISHYDLDNRINLRIINLGDGEWHTYDYGGKTLEEAFNSDAKVDRIVKVYYP